MEKQMARHKDIHYLRSIAGFRVRITERQALRWNEDDTTLHDLRTITVESPTQGWITMLRAWIAGGVPILPA